MDYVETEGDTIDKAIENALKLLGVERDKITVDILSEGKKGILGFGSQKARIRAALRKSAIDCEVSELQPAALEEQLVAEEAAAIGEKAKEVLAEILKLMGIKSRSRIEDRGEERRNRGGDSRRKQRPIDRAQGTDPRSAAIFGQPYRRRARRNRGSPHRRGYRKLSPASPQISGRYGLTFGGEGEATEKDRDRGCLERRRSPDYSRGAARRSLGNNQESGAGFVSPAVDHPRRRSKKEGRGPSSCARETGS